mgnify:CR=1 FL=1
MAPPPGSASCSQVFPNFPLGKVGKVVLATPLSGRSLAPVFRFQLPFRRLRFASLFMTVSILRLRLGATRSGAVHSLQLGLTIRRHPFSAKQSTYRWHFLHRPPELLRIGGFVQCSVRTKAGPAGAPEAQVRYTSCFSNKI